MNLAALQRVIWHLEGGLRAEAEVRPGDLVALRALLAELRTQDARDRETAARRVALVRWHEHVNGYSRTKALRLTLERVPGMSESRLRDLLRRPGRIRERGEALCNDWREHHSEGGPVPEGGHP